MADCVFCKILKGEIPSEKIYEDDRIFAFHDINSVSPVHVLIIPKKHISCISELKDEDSNILSDIFMGAKKIALDLNLSDYRLVINNGREVGQTVFHIHLHLLGGRYFSWPPG